MAHRKAFFAYPSKPSDLKDTIELGVEICRKEIPDLEIIPWPQIDPLGSYIPDEVRAEIDSAHAFICDITTPNLNVYYEAGFAIGLGKSIVPLVNEGFSGAVSDIQNDGIFDNIGFRTYVNAPEIVEQLKSLQVTNLVELYAKPINHEQPLFILDTQFKTDFRNAIVSSVKESRVNFRSFDPVEFPRFTTVSMIADVTSSAGVVVPLLLEHTEDSKRHNLRAAYLSGFCHGVKRNALLIRPFEENAKLPADFRDYVIQKKHPSEIGDEVVAFAKSAIINSQSIQPKLRRAQRSPLQKLTLGSTAAENEFRRLESYFVETSEYLRAQRGDISVVTGRKGSGKTAIFFRVRDRLREKSGQITIDLRPESHQLSLFREELLRIDDVGLFDHTFAAFWHFLILSEVLLSLKGGFARRERFDANALNNSREIDEVLEELEILESGDFTSRINRLGSSMVQEIKKVNTAGRRLSASEVTNIVYRDGIAKIKEAIIKFTNTDARMTLLFDNLDKGWPADGLDTFDVRLIRLLLETLNKVRRELDSENRQFNYLVFLRNDVYELMINVTPDRGKSGQVGIDWTDRAKLRQVIYRRLQASVDDQNVSFETLWSRFFVTKVNGSGSFEYLLDHCLMRPRFLINLVENAISNAINRGHAIVEADDFIEAVRQHSFLLINDFGYEIRDVSGVSNKILHSLVGLSELLTKDEILARLRKFDVPDERLEKIFKLMLWYGVFGLAISDDERRYIYNYEYNMDRLEADITLRDGDILYETNPAFQVALSSQ